MVSDVIGTVADEVGGAVDDAIGEDLAKADKLLSGKERSRTDIEKVEAEFVRGVDLSTPDGDVPSTAAAPNDPGAAAQKFSTLSGFRSQSTPGGDGYSELIFERKDAQLAAAIAAFQGAQSLPVTGELDDASRDALLEAHGS